MIQATSSLRVAYAYVYADRRQAPLAANSA